MMAARIFRGLENKQTRACAGHDSAPLNYPQLASVWAHCSFGSLRATAIRSVFLVYFICYLFVVWFSHCLICVPKENSNVNTRKKALLAGYLILHVLFCVEVP